MNPAPNDSLASTPTPRAEANFNYLLIALATGLLAYTLVAGLSLANGRIPVARAYLLMSPIPFLLALWHLYGSMRQSGARRDIGLFISALGWALVMLVLILKHGAVQAALSANTPLNQVSDGPITWICTLAALVALGVGASLSARFWRGLKE